MFQPRPGAHFDLAVLGLRMKSSFSAQIESTLEVMIGSKQRCKNWIKSARRSVHFVVLRHFQGIVEQRLQVHVSVTGSSRVEGQTQFVAAGREKNDTHAPV